MEKAIKNIISDIDGNTYNGIQIENQFWLTENLNVSKYRNGDDIPEVKDKKEWKKLKSGAWCYYENNAENGTIYGKLYNWYAVTDPRGLAPEGYHIPSSDEWNTMLANLGGDFGAGGKMKEKGTTHWNSPNEKATNQSGFTALPAGSRWEEEFAELGDTAEFWSTKEYNPDVGGSLKVTKSNKKAMLSVSLKKGGSSVRCIKNSEELIIGIKLGNLEVFNKNIGEFSFNDAKLACAKIGGGWRLPTKEELNQLFENKDVIGYRGEGAHWSSTKTEILESGYVWGQRFTDGYQNYYNTTSKFKCFVIPVKSI
jgi:uncharacterized protein (TIGR02145 family)